jgi:hypothetical protein
MATFDGVLTNLMETEGDITSNAFPFLSGYTQETVYNPTINSPDLPLTPIQSSAGDLLNPTISVDIAGNDYRALSGYSHGSVEALKGTVEFSGYRAIPIGRYARLESVPREIHEVYRDADRLAMVATLKRADGVKIQNALTIFLGTNYKEIQESNEHGFVGAYLMPDNYYSTIAISPNGIVYMEIDRKQFQNGSYEIIMARKTKANATFRQLHRMFD